MSLIQGTKREENFLNYIKSLHLEGFKKFISLDVNFNAHMNILVGENEAGKSTILDAIKIVLNQQYRNADKSVLRDLFNTKMIFKLFVSSIELVIFQGRYSKCCLCNLNRKI